MAASRCRCRWQTSAPTSALVAASFILILMATPDAVLGRRGGAADRKNRQPPPETKGVLWKHAGLKPGRASAAAESETPPATMRCPSLCACQLLKVYCEGRNLRQLPRHLPKEAEVIMAKDNQLRRLWQHQLAGMSAVRHLNLKCNQLHYIEPSALIDLHRLNSLNLMDNRLHSLSPATFRNKRQLQFLSLKRNRLHDVERLFRRLPRLHLLDLGENRVQRITALTFKNNAALRVLDLHHNRIKHVDKHAFRALPLLKFLILRDNPLTQVDMDFKLNFHLELLDFTNCRLTRMVRGLPHSVRDLRLAENRISALDGRDFDTTRRIRLLVLDHNDIRRVANDTFRRLWQLYDLDLSRNRIEQLPPRLPATLHGLYAAHNRIRHIERTAFSANPNMEFLSLKANHIRSLHTDSLQGLPRLKSLDLSHNGLSDLRPLVFRDLSRLQVLDLSDNPLDQVQHNCFEGLRNLHILQLSSVASGAHGRPPPPAVIFRDMRRLLFLDLHNSSRLARQLADSTYVLRYLRSVEDLNLIDDGLYGLPSSFPRHFPHLKAVKMVGNPWHCDISIYWLTLWMRRAQVDFFQADDMRCASPPELLGRKISELREDELPRPRKPPPRRRVQIPIFEIPFKHSLNNKTIFFNVSVEEQQSGKQNKLASIRFGEQHRVQPTPPPPSSGAGGGRGGQRRGQPASKRAGKKWQQQRRRGRRPNDVLLSDSGAMYTAAGDNALSRYKELLLAGLQGPLEEEEEQVEREKQQVKRGSRRSQPSPPILRMVGDDLDGSGNIVVSGALAQRALGAESSGEADLI